MVIVTKFILQHNIAVEITSSAHAFTLQAMATHGDELSSGTLLHTLLPGIPPRSLAKLIARDTAMSTLDALANHLTNEAVK
jgi:hypothetical protein